MEAPFDMVVAIVAIGCGTGVLHSALATIRAGIARRAREQDHALTGELSALRGEVAQLRAQHAEEVLSFDTTVERMERRLQFVEGRGQLPAESSAAEATSLPVGR